MAMVRSHLEEESKENGLGQLETLLKQRKDYLDKFHSSTLSIAKKNQDAAVKLFGIIEADTIASDFDKFVKKYDLMAAELKKAVDLEQVLRKAIKEFDQTLERNKIDDEVSGHAEECYKQFDEQFQLFKKTFPRPQFISLKQKLQDLSSQLSTTIPSDRSDDIFKAHSNEQQIQTILSSFVDKYCVLNDNLKQTFEELKVADKQHTKEMADLFTKSSQMRGEKIKQHDEKIKQHDEKIKQHDEKIKQGITETIQLQSELAVEYDKLASQMRQGLANDVIQGFSAVPDLSPEAKPLGKSAAIQHSPAAIHAGLNISPANKKVKPDNSPPLPAYLNEPKARQDNPPSPPAYFDQPAPVKQKNIAVLPKDLSKAKSLA